MSKKMMMLIALLAAGAFALSACDDDEDTDDKDTDNTGEAAETDNADGGPDDTGGAADLDCSSVGSAGTTCEVTICTYMETFNSTYSAVASTDALKACGDRYLRCALAACPPEAEYDLTIGEKLNSCLETFAACVTAGVEAMQQ